MSIDVPRRGPTRKPGCVALDKVVITGVSLVDPEKLRAKLVPGLSACVANENIKQALTVINEEHAQAGYVTTQGYLPDQDIRKTRILRIDIIPGRIDRITYKGVLSDPETGSWRQFVRSWQALGEAKTLPDALDRTSEFIDSWDDPLDRFQIIPPDISERSPRLWTGMAAASGDVVRVEALQQGLDRLNRVSSARAKVRLLPGSKPATSDVLIEDAGLDTFRVVTAYEINGGSLNDSGATVPARLRLDVAKDNLIGINDAWQASYAGGLTSNEVRAGLTFPYINFTFGLNGGYTENTSELAPGLELFSRTRQVATSADYLLRQTEDVQSRVESSLAWRSGERFLSDFALAPQNVTQVRLGVTETRLFPGLQVSYGFGVGQGVQAYHANRDSDDAGPTVPRAQFTKLDSVISVQAKLGTYALARFDVSGQWTRTPLFSDDQLVLGSPTTLRGFTNHTNRADRGVVVRTEIAPAERLDVMLKTVGPVPDVIDTFLASLSPYAFMDFGHGRDIANREDITRASVGSGLRFKKGRVSFDVSLGEPVFRRGGAPARGWQTPEVTFSVSAKLF